MLADRLWRMAKHETLVSRQTRGGPPRLRCRQEDRFHAEGGMRRKKLLRLPPKIVRDS